MPKYESGPDQVIVNEDASEGASEVESAPIKKLSDEERDQRLEAKLQKQFDEADFTTYEGSREAMSHISSAYSQEFARKFYDAFLGHLPEKLTTLSSAEQVLAFAEDIQYSSSLVSESRYSYGKGAPKMADIFNLPDSNVQAILGGLNDLKTVFDFKKGIKPGSNGFPFKGTNLDVAVEAKWANLITDSIQSADGIQGLRDVRAKLEGLYSHPSDPWSDRTPRAIHGQIVKKWNELVLPLAESANSLEDILKADEQFLRTYNWEKYPAVDLLRQKWESQTEQSIARAKTIADFKEAFQQAPGVDSNAYYDGGGTGWRLTKWEDQILTLWNEKFTELFDASISTKDRIELLKNAPFSNDRNPGILTSNARLFDRSLFQTIDQAEDINALRAIQDYIRAAGTHIDYYGGFSRRISGRVQSLIMGVDIESQG